jgi:hypothetical protein
MTAADGLATPILLIVFNRPDTTAAVLESIRRVRPRSLYVAADGPRTEIVEDPAKCQEARRIATAVDWECRLETLFRDQNQGAGAGVASAINWFFDHVEDGIILEDDCVADNSFYRFSAELLQYYRSEKRVMHISGHNFQYGRNRGRASYYFSRWTHSGAWASWRRAWKCYDFTLIPERERSHVWDAQWMLSVERHNGVAVIPNLNLVTNIGYGPEATHTRTMARHGFLPASEMMFPLTHPPRIVIDREADRLTYYANIRNVPDLRFIWLYRLVDWFSLIPRRIQKVKRRLGGQV